MKKIIIIIVSFIAFGPVEAQPLTLDSCIAIARRNNAEIQASRKVIEQARFFKKEAYTRYFPNVRATAVAYNAANPIVRYGIDDVQSSDAREFLEAFYEEFSADLDISREITMMQHGVNMTVTAVQPVYLGGRIRNVNKLASLGVEAAELVSEKKERDLIEDLEETFYLVVGLKEKGETLEAALGLIDSLDRVVSSALSNGLVTHADALQLELKRNELKANEQQYKSGVRLARRLLCTQIGIDYNDALEFEEPNASLPPKLQFVYADRADSLRPEMRLLQLNVDRAELQKKISLGAVLPHVAVAAAGYYGNAISHSFKSNIVASVVLSIPLTDWWPTSYKKQRHDVAIDQARLLQEHYSTMMSLEEEKAYTDMVDAWMLIRSDSAALDIAKENYRIANLNYKSGNMTLSDVLQAHTLLLQAQNALTDRRVSYIIARRRLEDLRGIDK